MENTTAKKERLKFYADTPSGDKNKLFVFNISNMEHAIDLAAIFVQEKGFTIRAAYYENPLSKSMRIDKFCDLKTWQNSLIEKQNRQNLLKKHSANIY